jgi:hypothetical protein
MKMYIELKDGVIHNHPILEDNLIHLGFDINNLPNNYVEFVRDDYSISSTKLKAGQWLEYYAEYNEANKIVYEYSIVMGEAIPADPNMFPPGLLIGRE